MGSGLRERVAVVTGAGSGIGRAIAHRFAAEGASVVVSDVRSSAAQRCAGEITSAAGRAVPVEADVSLEEQVHALVTTAQEAFGGLDVFVSNAATTRLGTAVELTTDDWDLIWRTNVSSVFFAAKHAVPALAARGGGSLIATASISALMADEGQVAYAASKAAVIGLTRALAVDHAALGVRANCICPGMTASPSLLRALGDGVATAAAVPPLARLADPDEIAGVALWLAGPDSSYVTGQAIVVDGGLTSVSHFSRL